MKVDANGDRIISNLKTKNGKSVSVLLKVNKTDGKIHLKVDRHSYRNPGVTIELDEQIVDALFDGLMVAKQYFAEKTVEREETWYECSNCHKKYMPNGNVTMMKDQRDPNVFVPSKYNYGPNYGYVPDLEKVCCDKMKFEKKTEVITRKYK